MRLHQIQIMKRRREIESTGRFIQYQCSGAMHQRTAQEAAPLLAGRHLRKSSVGQETDTKLLHHGMGTSNLSKAKVLMPLDADARIVA